MLHTSLDWTPFGQYLIDFIKKDSARPGNTAKESERNLAVHTAELNSIAQGIAYLGTAQRVEKLAPLMEQVNESRKYAPMLEQYTVRQWLTTVRQRWDNKVWKDTPDEEWLLVMQHEFDDLVFDDHVTSVIRGYRKDLILAGLIEPTEDDKHWLQQEFDNLNAVVSPYMAALEKLKG